MPKTKTQILIARFTICAIIAETLMQIVSVWTTTNGLMMANKSLLESLSIAIACGFTYLVISWFVTYLGPRATNRQFALIAGVLLLVVVPLYTTISTQFTVMDLGAREAEKVHMAHVIADADDTVREIIASNSEEERLVLTLGPLGQNWKNRSAKERKSGHDSGSVGPGHVESTEDNIGDTILAAVSAVERTTEERKTLTSSIKEKLVNLQTTIADRYGIEDEQKLRENAISFGNTLRSLNEDLARLANLRSLDFVKAIAAQLSAVQGGDRRSDSVGQSEAMKDVTSMVVATKKIVEALTEKMNINRNVKTHVFTMVSPTEAVWKYKWEVAYAWGAGYGMDYLWFVFVALFRVTRPLWEQMTNDEREELAAAAEQERQKADQVRRESARRNIASL